MKKWQKTGLLIVWCIIIAGCFYFRKELTTEQILNHTPGNLLAAFFMMMGLFAVKSVSVVIYSDSINADEYKTKTIVSFLSAVGADKKALIVIPEVNDKVIKSARNIPGVKTAQVNTINVYDILNADKLIIAKDALTKIEEVYA